MTGDGEPVVTDGLRTGDADIRILHLEDDPGFAELTTAALERAGDDVTVVAEHSVADAVERFAAERFDCVVSDYELPDGDGLDFLRAVREHDADVPFVLFTGRGSEEVASEAISAGVSEYLQKGGGTEKFDVLANRVRNLVAGARARRAVDRSFAALDTAREGVAILDADGRFTYVNERYAEALGYDRDELLGSHWDRLYTDDAAAAMREEVVPAVPDEGRWTGETVFRRGDGGRVLADHALARTADGGFVCLVSPLAETDGDDAPVADAADLLVDDDVLRSLLDALDDIFYVLDAEGRIVRVNDRAADVTGVDRCDLRGRSALSLVAPDDREAVAADLERAAETGRTCVEADLRTADGRDVPHEFRKAAVTDTEGEVVGFVGIGRDVSERRRRERRLRRQAEQFEAFGSVLAHDLRNPLNAATGHLEMARETGDDEHFAAAASALDRLDALVGDLAEVMRAGEFAADPEPVAVGAVAREVWTALDTAGARLETESGRVVADRDALARLLENLLQNAVEHAGRRPAAVGGDSPGAGAGVDASADDAALTVTVAVTDDGFVVADDGPGFDAADPESLFDPGETTKAEGGGVGLLSVRQIATAHGWSVTATAGDDGGARFEITDVTRP